MKIPQDPTLQELFDYVALHLLTQGTEADDGLYHVLADRKGRRCSIGCLIRDRDIKRLDVRKTESTKAVRSAVARGIGVESLHDYTVDLLGDLREVHDHDPVTRWVESLRAVATKYDLDHNAIDDWCRQAKRLLGVQP